MERRPLPIGFDDFKDVIEGGYYYVDKTLLIKDLVDLRGKVNLFTRPRRFGKTMNLSMLQYYFEDTGDEKLNAENSQLFTGMKILEAGDKYVEYKNKYPVICLSFKSGKQSSCELAVVSLKRQIANEFRRHEKIADSLGDLRQRFERIMREEGDLSDYIDAIAFLSQCLNKVHGKNCLIFLDEYDVPLENAYFEGFYDQMAGFIRSLFESAFKTNPFLDFAVITGCLRIMKESIFTGLNNLKVISILNDAYGEYFGFEQHEVDTMLNYYGVYGQCESVRKWYDGYLFGGIEVYNPWSVVNYVEALSLNPEAFPAPYWANTSSNSIIKTLIEQSDLNVKGEIEKLIAGDSIEKPVHEEVTYADIALSRDNLWNFLFFTGYLKLTTKRMEGEDQIIGLKIPNLEVRYIYRNTIVSWFQDRVRKEDLSRLYQSLMEGNERASQEEISRLLANSISYMDSQEAFYHGFLLGILGGLTDYLVQSNREGGNGRYDIVVRNQDVKKAPVLIELKVSDTYAGLEKRCIEALKQIEEKKYDNWLPQEGYKEVIHCGIAFFKKQCCVKTRRKILVAGGLQ